MSLPGQPSRTIYMIQVQTGEEKDDYLIDAFTSRSHAEQYVYETIVEPGTDITWANVSPLNLPLEV